MPTQERRERESQRDVAQAVWDQVIQERDALRAQVKNLEADAARWRSLVGSARVRVLGSAGITPNSQVSDPAYAHIGLELWTVYPGIPPEENAHGAERLTAYADKARMITQAQA